MSSVCSAVQTIKSGNGSQTQFSFDFPYVFKSEIHVYFWNVTTKEYDEILTTDATYPWEIPTANPTVVNFTGTAPPSPSDATANIKIRRITNIDDIQALFNPGSAIRSDDLNSNFEQLRFAVQESLCPDITEAEVVTYLQNYYWNNFEDTVTSTDTWNSSDTKIATTAAIQGQLTNIDISQIKSDDIIETSAYSSTWDNEDDKIATAGALAARHDVVVNTDVNPPTTTQTGKQWLSTAPGNQVHKIYDGSGWRTVAVGQPFSPATTTVVRYVDVTNGSDASDVTGFLPQAPLQSIGRALELINASSNGDGSLIKVAPGVYQETLPLRIKKNNISIVGESMRSCFVHPTVATENNDMFEVDSGSYIANLTLLGLKVPTADQGSRNNSLDNDATYGLPSNQPFSVRFRTDVQPVILKSPYIQNCTHFSDAHFDNANFDPNTFPSTDGQTYSAVAGDQTSAPCGGGLLIDGSAVSSSSPVRSMVVDAFTQITLDGPGVLVTNNGYAQLVSFFGTFAHYHAKAKNGGQINLSNCVSDFGRYGLIADGKSPSAIATATASAASSGATTITIGAITTAGSFHGTVSRPLDHMMVTIDGVDYGVVSSTANGAGWDIVLTSGLTSNITNTTVSFALRSYISTGGHTFEFVGVGTDYSDHPDNGGVPIEANQVIELNGGKVWQSSTDHVGKFKAGDVLVVDQVSETVALKDTTVTGDLAVTGTVDGRDVATDGTKLDGIEANATADQTDAEIKTAYENNADTNAFTDAEQTKLAGIAAGAEVNVQSDWNATSGDAFIANKPTIPAAQVNSDWNATSGVAEILNKPTLASGNVVDDTTPQLGGNLDVQSNEINTSISNGNIKLNPNGSGVVEIKGDGITNDGTLQLNCSQNSHGVKIKSPPHSAAASYTLTLPDTDGNANEVLKTDGSGNLSWVVQTSGYTDSNVDTHLNTGTASAGEVLSWTGSDYDWVAQSGGGGGITVQDEGSALSTTATTLNFVGAGVTASGTGATKTITISGGGASDIDGLSDGYTDSTNNIFGLGATSYGATSTNNLMIGLDTGTGTLTSNNTLIGIGVGNNLTTAYSSVGIGNNVFGSITGAVSLDVAIGHNAMANLSSTQYTGYHNVAIGGHAMETLGSSAIGNVAVGLKTGASTTSGDYNVYIGWWAGSDGTTAWGNQAIGRSAGYSITTGDSNSILGDSAGYNLTTGNDNVFIGSEAGYRCITNGKNTFVGHEAGMSELGQQNTYIGNNAGPDSTAVDNDDNTAVGHNSLHNVAGGANRNTAIGYYAGSSVTTGDYNTFLGESTGGCLTGSYNIVIGSGATTSSSSVSNEITIGTTNTTRFRLPGLQASASNGDVLTYNSTTGLTEFSAPAGGGLSDTSVQADSLGVGTNALSNEDSNAAFGENTAFGQNALDACTTGMRHTAVGLNTLSALQTGTDNTAVGASAGIITTGSSNTYLGSLTGTLNVSGEENTYVGAEAGQFNTGSKNVSIGFESNQGASSGTANSQNTCIGFKAGHVIGAGNDENVMIGSSAGNQEQGAYNVYIGSGVGNPSTPSDNNFNVAIGRWAFRGTGGGAEYNVVIGSQAGQAITVADDNTIVGGVAGGSITTGIDNVIIGRNAGNNLDVGDNNIVIGKNAQASSNSINHEITIGNGSQFRLRLPGLTVNASNSDRLYYNSSSDTFVVQSGPVIETSTSSATCDFTASEAFNRTVAANTTFVFTTTNLPTTEYLTWVLTVEHTGGTITWPANVVWPDNTAPTLTAGATVVHTFIFTTNDGGTTLRGAALPNYST